jgi:hypothetical protein
MINTKFARVFKKNTNTHKVHCGGLSSYIPFQLGKPFTYDVMIYDKSFFSTLITRCLTIGYIYIEEKDLGTQFGCF